MYYFIIGFTHFSNNINQVKVFNGFFLHQIYTISYLGQNRNVIDTYNVLDVNALLLLSNVHYMLELLVVFIVIFLQPSVNNRLWCQFLFTNNRTIWQRHLNNLLKHRIDVFNIESNTFKQMCLIVNNYHW